MEWKPILRIGADIAMIALIAWAPVWLGAIAAVASAWIFAPYYELIVWGLAYGALYGAHDWRGVAIAFAVIAAAELLRRRFRLS